MFTLKYVFLAAACLILTVSASPIEFADLYELQQDALEYQYEPVLVRQVRQIPSPYSESYDLDLYAGFEPVLSRQARSPQGGNLNVGVAKDDFGRHANVDYTHNLYSSSDGRGSIDAYAQASRNFDSNRNNFNGGIIESWRF